MKTAAIYARVSSDKQKEENTIASQTAALVAFAAEQGYAVPPEWVFQDEGYSGASLIRPGLERVRDLAAEGQLLLQFQGMIAEYERAQILERSRRGKRHRARQGQVSVLSGAPFGYRYI